MDLDYKYFLQGGFYIVFVNADGEYHMAKAEEKSLRARAHFYKKFICKDKYPFFSRKFGMNRETISGNENIIQVLGLPEEVTYEKVNDTIRLLTVDEIINRIHFDDSIRPFYPKPEKNDSTILEGNDPSLIYLINHLMENGFYIMNPERFLDISSLDEKEYLPVYIDEELMPDYLKNENETSHKLIMDFVTDSFAINKKAFMKYFAPLDRMSLNEKAALAFSRKEDRNLDIAEREMLTALRRYFLSLALKVSNDYYQKNFGIRGIFGFTVLDNDFGLMDTNHRYVYLGSRFDMYARRIRHFTLEGEEVHQSFTLDEYCLDQKVKKKLSIAFETVHAYFLRHKEYAFIPSVFLKMLGLPYPAFKYVKDIDLEKIDTKSFLSRFIYEGGIDCTNHGLILTTLSLEGRQISMKNWNTKIPYYLKKCNTANTFFSNFSGFLNIGYNNFLFHHVRRKKDKLNGLFDGETDLFRKSLGKFEDKYSNSSMSLQFLENVKSFLVIHDRNGVLAPVKKYFDLLSSGFDSLEAENELKKEFAVDLKAMHFLINMVFFTIMEGRANDFVENIQQDIYIFPGLLKMNEAFIDDYLIHPVVSKGRNFLAYRDRDSETWIFDEKDKPAIENLIKIYHTYFDQKHKNEFPYVIKAFGKEIGRTYESIFIDDEIYDCIQFLGLPLEVSLEILFDLQDLNDLHFEKNISIYQDKRHKKLLREDESLSRLAVFSEACRKGIYLMNSNSNQAYIYCLKKKLDPLISLYLESEVIQGYCLESTNDNMRYHAYSSKESFRRDFLGLLFDNEKLSNQDKICIESDPLDYGGELSNAIYESIHEELFGDGKRQRKILGYIHKENGYVAPGRCFNCYSLSNDIDSFGFLDEDRPYILKGFEKLKKDFQSKANTRRYTILSIIQGLGIPVIMRKKFFDILYANDLNLRMEDIPSFREDVLIPSNYCYQDFFSAIDIEDYGNLYSAKLLKEARRQGMMVFANHELFDPVLLSPSLMAVNLDSSYEKIKECRTLILPETVDAVDELVHPSEISFALTVKDFISTYDSKTTSFYNHFLFYVQELLIYAYHNNPDFIKDYYNRRQVSLDDKPDREFFMEYVSDLYLPEITPETNYQTIIEFISLFFIYLEQSTLFRISRTLKKG